MGLGPSY